MRTFKRFLGFALEHYLVLPVGGILAIVWANTYAASYFEAAQALAFWVNDVGMALVFAYVAQEAIEAALSGGTLHPGSSAVAPVVAGLGGIVGAIAVYAGYIRAGDETVLAQGWPVVCAVDLLFSIAIARLIFRRTASTSFLLVLALTTDVLGVTVVSYHRQLTQPHPAAGLLIIPALAVCFVLRWSRVRSVWPYLVLTGPLSWVACYSIDVHPALALLPVVPFLPHTARDLNDRMTDERWPHASATHLEHVFRYPVQAIAFLFALINAGVLMRGFGTGTWAVLLASLVGRPVGILVGTGLVAAAALRLPRVVGWRELVVIALAATPGLTFGLFLASAVFPPGPLLVETKIGALSTAVGALPALLAARLLRVGRFSRLLELRPPIDARLMRGRA